jgi:hypothetical protein
VLVRTILTWLLAGDRSGYQKQGGKQYIQRMNVALLVYLHASFSGYKISQGVIRPKNFNVGSVIK